MKKLLLLVMLSVPALLAGTPAKSPENPPVLILDLKLVQGTFYLRHFNIVPGPLEKSEQLKPAAGLIYYTVMDHSGRPLDAGVMRAPSAQPPNPSGQEETLRGDSPGRDSVDLELKLPYELAIHRVHFARVIRVYDSAGIAMMETKDMGAVYVERHGEPDEE